MKAYCTDLNSYPYYGPVFLLSLQLHLPQICRRRVKNRGAERKSSERSSQKKLREEVLGLSREEVVIGGQEERRMVRQKVAKDGCGRAPVSAFRVVAPIKFSL